MRGHWVVVLLLVLLPTQAHAHGCPLSCQSHKAHSPRPCQARRRRCPQKPLSGLAATSPLSQINSTMGHLAPLCHPLNIVPDQGFPEQGGIFRTLLHQEGRGARPVARVPDREPKARSKWCWARPRDYLVMEKPRLRRWDLKAPGSHDRRHQLASLDSLSFALCHLIIPLPGIHAIFLCTHARTILITFEGASFLNLT